MSDRCQETVYVPDDYRLAGGSGFTMRYIGKRCSRPATRGRYCWQHGTEADARAAQNSAAPAPTEEG